MDGMWVKEGHELSVDWLWERCGIRCDGCHVEDMSQATAPGTVFRLRLKQWNGIAMQGRDVKTLVLKVHSVVASSMVGDRMELTKRLGWAREAEVYLAFGGSNATSEFGSLLPHCFYAACDLNEGTKVIVMEDLGDEFVNCALLFGEGTPHNWGKDLARAQERAGNPPLSQVVATTFRLYARMHARYWDQHLPHLTWLRGRGILGDDATEFLTAANSAISNWETARATDAVAWFDPLVVQAIDKAVKGTTWETCRRPKHWTLVHGDCWPGNSLWRRDGTVKLIDFEMCGLGSGPQELGQYMLACTEAGARKSMEQNVVREYYDELIRCGVRAYSWEECWDEYRLGGLERWLWFLSFCAGVPAMHDFTRFFHNQISSFMVDHNLSATQVKRFRV